MLAHVSILKTYVSSLLLLEGGYVDIAQRLTTLDVEVEEFLDSAEEQIVQSV